MEEKKKFVIPEAEIVNFKNDDIITASVAEDTENWPNGGFDTDDF